MLGPDEYLAQYRAVRDRADRARLARQHSVLEAAEELALVDLEVEASLEDVDRDPIAFPDHGERPAPHGWELWAPLRPLYEAGEHAEVADRARVLVEAHPQYALLFFNLTCCESLAGRTTEALDHLRHAIDMSEQVRAYAKSDSDFDPIREEPGVRPRRRHRPDSLYVRHERRDLPVPNLAASRIPCCPRGLHGLSILTSLRRQMLESAFDAAGNTRVQPGERTYVG